MIAYLHVILIGCRDPIESLWGFMRVSREDSTEYGLSILNFGDIIHWDGVLA